MNETVLDMEEDAWDELQHETIIGKAGNRRELLGYTIRGYTHIQIHIISDIIMITRKNNSNDCENQNDNA